MQTASAISNTDNRCSNIDIDNPISISEVTMNEDNLSYRTESPDCQEPVNRNKRGKRGSGRLSIIPTYAINGLPDLVMTQIRTLVIDKLAQTAIIELSAEITTDGMCHQPTKGEYQ